jgi:murein L,D-transpeptidase YafK
MIDRRTLLAVALIALAFCTGRSSMNSPAAAAPIQSRQASVATANDAPPATTNNVPPATSDVSSAPTSNPLAATAKDGPPPGPVDFVLVEKAARRMVLLSHGAPVREYHIHVGQNLDGPKRCEGDRRTPEGLYVLDERNPHSRAHKAIHVSYPSEADRREAAELRCRPGGNVMIHGKYRSWRRPDPSAPPRDWTFGCIVVTDAEIDEIWDLVPPNTPIEIRP